MKTIEQNKPTKKVEDKLIDLSKGEIENDIFRRCRQFQCSFFQNGQCRACENCGTPSLILKKDCRKCILCEGVANELRWGDNNIDNKEDAKISRKRMIIMAGGIPIGMVEEIEPQQRKPKEEKEMVM